MNSTVSNAEAPLKMSVSLNVPWIVPSADAPLSPRGVHTRLQPGTPRGGVLGLVLGEVIALLRGAPRLDWRRPLIDGRIPLVGLAANEPVEVLEATPAGGPGVEGAYWACLVHRYLMALPELRRRVA